MHCHRTARHHTSRTMPPLLYARQQWVRGQINPSSDHSTLLTRNQLPPLDSNNSTSKFHNFQYTISARTLRCYGKSGKCQPHPAVRQRNNLHQARFNSTASDNKLTQLPRLDFLGALRAVRCTKKLADESVRLLCSSPHCDRSSSSESHQHVLPLSNLYLL